MGVVECHNMLMLLAGELDDDDDDEDDHDEDDDNYEDDDDEDADNEHEKIAVAKEMTEAERDAVIPLMMQVLEQIVMSATAIILRCSQTQWGGEPDY